ncbi:20961_t:CDS:2 [Dentiscutata erythropus]|uniref:20961_t:CDS:1 n=1 Tax=Dentiscutata erythropus TaxID=1348616 RepID=A0A9N8ZX56_9GLOM|nr:20961_t:CDS:2 [Dentiscutata erythropus]
MDSIVEILEIESDKERLLLLAYGPPVPEKVFAMPYRSDNLSLLPRLFACSTSS